MCYNFRKTKRKAVIGWKLVAVKKSTGEYYSAAMGFKYKNGKIPVCKKQKRIRNGFRNTILKDCFEDDMVGRTSVFLTKGAVENTFWSKCLGTKKGYEIKAVKVKLTKDLIMADYGSYTVYAGRNIKFLKK